MHFPTFTPHRHVSHVRPRWGVLSLIVLATFVAISGCQVQQTEPVEGIEVTLTEDNFEQEVLNSEMPVFVDFEATWCGPCQYMKPIVATLSNDFEGRAKIGKLDVDESPNISREYEINGIPAFLIFKDGKVVGRVEGTESYRKLAELLESFIDEPTKASL